MRIKIEDLPPRLQEQVRAQLAGNAKATPAQAADRGAVVKRQRTPRAPACSGQRGRCPNKTEADYRRQYLAGLDARYEGLTFRMANGHRYTPDWVVFEDGRPVACHECKGGYALHSEQRARLAFDQARVEFPWVKWVWAVKRCGRWSVDS